MDLSQRLPDAAQRRVDRLPLLALGGELLAAARRDAVVLAPASALRGLPAGFDVGQALEAMQHRVEHPVGPLDAAGGELADALQDGVAVAVALRQDRQDDRSRRSGHQVLADRRMHGSTIHSTAMYVN